MSEEWWADYSAGTVSAATLKQHGYTGVIRYVTAPELMNPAGKLQKHTTKKEFDEHRAAGLKQLLVYQDDTNDPDSGFDGGVRNAKRAQSGCKYLGYSGVVFFANDRTTLPNADTWRAYLKGAASVLGADKIGAYGFGNAMDAAKNHAKLFWQAGRRDDVRAHVHIWQDNNNQPVVNDGGRRVTTDRNLILKPVRSGGAVSLSDDDLKRIYQAVWFGTKGAKFIPVRQPGRPDGWPEYVLGSATDWVVRMQIEPMRKQLTELAGAVAKQQGLTAEDVADALRTGLVADIQPVLEEVLSDALGGEDEDQVNELAREAADKLSLKLAPGEEDE